MTFMAGLGKLLPSLKQQRGLLKENPKSEWEAMTSTKELLPTPNKTHIWLRNPTKQEGNSVKGQPTDIVSKLQFDIIS